MMCLRGMAWGHRRATGPLDALVDRYRELGGQINIEWTVRPLSDFEHQGIEEIARQFDLVIYDHPFSGDIALSEAFIALEEHVDALAIDRANDFIGPSLRSYWFRDHVWGVPIDGATQHALVRRDLLEGPIPQSWEEVLTLGHKLGSRGLFLAQAFETPHTILSAASLMANMGVPWQSEDEERIDIDVHGLREALELLKACFAFCPEQALEWNSIDVHDAMTRRNDLVYAPCVYGFATYGEVDHANRLSFGPFPGPNAPNVQGSTLGGAALGISRHCRDTPAAIGFARFLASPEVQTAIISAHHGQAAAAAAWESAVFDLDYNGFYTATRSTLESAWVRPRIPGYPDFQKKAGAIARTAIAGGLSLDAAVSKILKLNNGLI